MPATSVRQPAARAKRVGYQQLFLDTDPCATWVRHSLCRLQLHAVFCDVGVLHARVLGGSSRARGKTAGNRRSFVEAINIGGAGEGKTKETGTEGSGGSWK